jgi:hypothetical protein
MWGRFGILAAVMCLGISVASATELETPTIGNHAAQARSKHFTVDRAVKVRKPVARSNGSSSRAATRTYGPVSPVKAN